MHPASSTDARDCQAPPARHDDLEHGRAYGVIVRPPGTPAPRPKGALRPDSPVLPSSADNADRAPVTSAAVADVGNGAVQFTVIGAVPVPVHDTPASVTAGCGVVDPAGVT